MSQRGPIWGGIRDLLSYLSGRGDIVILSAIGSLVAAIVLRIVFNWVAVVAFLCVVLVGLFVRFLLRRM